MFLKRSSKVGGIGTAGTIDRDWCIERDRMTAAGTDLSGRKSAVDQIRFETNFRQPGLAPSIGELGSWNKPFANPLCCLWLGIAKIICES
jgi:hypothetical protein